MIIYIDKEGRENIIRSDELIEKLINENIIVENTLLKTEISGDWIVAKDFDLFKKIKKISKPEINTENLEKELLREYEIILKNPNNISDFQNKWGLQALELDDNNQLVKSSKEFSKSNIWLTHNEKIQYLLIGRNIISNYAAFVADDNRGLKENLNPIFDLKEGDEFEITKQPVIEKIKDNFLTQNKGILSIPKIKIKKNKIIKNDSKVNETKEVEDIKKEEILETKTVLEDQNDNNKIIDENFYVPKGSSVPKVESTKINNQNQIKNNEKKNIEQNPNQTTSDNSNNYKIINNLNIWSATSNCFSKFFDFQSRSRRSEYWYFYLFNLIVTIVLIIIEVSIDPYNEMYLADIYGLITFFPTLSCSVRRLHDVNRTGWWVLISITIIGIIPLLYWHCKDGDKDKNLYGNSTKYRINI